jgi:hypothetical protein
VQHVHFQTVAVVGSFGQRNSGRRHIHVAVMHMRLLAVVHVAMVHLLV